MKRLLVVVRVSAVAILAAGLFSQVAAASHPDILRNFRFIPSRSTLEVTGGFAGIEETFHAFGTFGLVTGYEEGVSCMAIGCPPPPTHLPYAEFFDVEAWLVPDGPLAYVWNLDQTLNLSGLHGTYQDPRLLFFHGHEGQGQPFRLRAAIRGPLIHLVGMNDPGCCDFFDYKFNALAHLAPYADFNLDGFIDLADVDRLMAHVGTQSGATFEQGDADGDGDVDGDDLLAWQRQVGSGVSLSEFDAASLGLGAVPEPAALALLVWGAIMATVSWRRRGF
jgi:hypothetical protein